MNESNVELDTENAAIAELPKSLSDEYREKMGKLLDLSDEQKDRIKKWLKENLTNWMSDTSELHQRLQDDNDLVEGIIMETDFPWVGCSNVHSPITEIYMDGSCSIEKRSILSAGLLWSASTDIDALSGLMAEVEEMMNFNARNAWNIERSIPGVLWTTNRDGLGIIQCPYVEEYEKTHDILVITSMEEFQAEFPTPEEAGVSEEQYYEILDMAGMATEMQPLEIPITFEKQTYAGPKAEIVELVDFVTIPAWVPHIKDARCRGYGKRFKAHIETIREKGEEGVYYKDASERVVNKGKETALTSYTQAKDDIIGIKRTSSKDERELYELVVKGRLEDDGEIRKLLVTYSLESDELLQAMDYVYRVDFYALFVADERPNQLVGKSIPAKTRDLNDLIDTQINQEINTRTISTVPIFKGKKDMKEELDPELQQNKIRPGMIIWINEFDAFDQFKIQPTDLGESAALQERAMRVLDMYIGMPASLFAGGVPTGDPSAPGNKTLAMIQQGNLRMETPISTLRQGVSDLGDICLSHVYQFGPPILEYRTEQVGNGGQKTKVTKSIHKKYLRKGIKMQMNGVTVIDNPESEMQKAFQLHQMLMTIPAYANNPKLQVEVGRDALQKGRVNGRERYLPTVEEIQAEQIEIQKQAMQKMMMEKQMAEQKAKEDMIKQNLAKVVQAEKIKNVLTKLAETNLGINGEGQ